MDEDWTTPSIDKKVEEKLEMLQKSLWTLLYERSDLWCTICMNEGHTKDYCKYHELN
jgi:hypothetical protein